MGLGIEKLSKCFILCSGKGGFDFLAVLSFEPCAYVTTAVHTLDIERRINRNCLLLLLKHIIVNHRKCVFFFFFQDRLIYANWEWISEK